MNERTQRISNICLFPMCYNYLNTYVDIPYLKTTELLKILNPLKFGVLALLGSQGSNLGPPLFLCWWLNLLVSKNSSEYSKILCHQIAGETLGDPYLKFQVWILFGHEEFKSNVKIWI